LSSRGPSPVCRFFFSLPLSLSLSLSLSLCSSRSLSSRSLQFLSPERNAMATLRGTKFRRKFLRKSHCHLSRSLIRRTYRSLVRCLHPRDGALLPGGDAARTSVFIAAALENAAGYLMPANTSQANLIYLKHRSRIIGSC